MKTIKAIPVFLCILILPGSMSGQNSAINTAAMIIESIIKQTASDPVSNTVDVIKAGDPQTPVTGIVTTMFATMDVLKKVFPKSAFNVIGNPEMKLTKVMFSAGAPPGSSTHFSMLADDNVDVVIVGEVPQWETYEYVRDAVSQGQSKAIIFLGHITSEEPGMEYCAEWLKGFIRNIPIHFVESGPSYWTY